LLPFPGFILGYAINGIGLALQVELLVGWFLIHLIRITQDAQANGFVASLKDNPEAKMGMLHAAYGKYKSL
jgi:hypothetical protein